MAYMCNTTVMMDIVLTVAEKKIPSVEPPKDNAGLNKPTVPRVENQAWNGIMDMPYNEPDGGPK